MRSGEDELWKDARFSCGPYELQCLFECASATFTALHAAPGNGGRTGERWDRRAAVKGGVVLCCVSGISAPDSWEGGQISLGEGGCCVWAPGEARTAPQSSAALEGDRHDV